MPTRAISSCSSFISPTRSERKQASSRSQVFHHNGDHLKHEWSNSVILAAGSKNEKKLPQSGKIRLHRDMNIRATQLELWQPMKAIKSMDYIHRKSYNHSEKILDDSLVRSSKDYLKRYTIAERWQCRQDHAQVRPACTRALKQATAIQAVKLSRQRAILHYLNVATAWMLLKLSKLQQSWLEMKSNRWCRHAKACGGAQSLLAAWSDFITLQA